MKNPKALAAVIFILLSLIIIYFISVIFIGVVTDYQPEKITSLEIEGNANSVDVGNSTFTFLTWNIGYSGLGAESDFFYDGGEHVHPTPAQVKRYNEGIFSFLLSADTIDFILLQEVEKNSKRTGRQNQVKIIESKLPEYAASFGLNYNVRFVPLPFFSPLGKVEMGQMSLSKFWPVSSERISFYSAYSWPKRLFMLDRCFIVSTFTLKNGKNLVVINTHNSAYDSGGKLRQQEMPVIRDFMLKEFEAGNYVVAGGDWNQNPPGYNLNDMADGFHAVKRIGLDSTLFPDDWQIVYDPQKPTNREIDAPYSKEKTEVTIIDYFITSPNVRVEKIKVLSQNFANSDHEPVFLKVSLK